MIEWSSRILRAVPSTRDDLIGQYLTPTQSHKHRELLAQKSGDQILGLGP